MRPYETYPVDAFLVIHHLFVRVIVKVEMEETGKDRAAAVLMAALVLLVAFAAASIHLNRESFWYDEAWTAWAIRSPYVSDTLTRVREDVHPPLYFALLDGWSIVTGESVYALRLPSALAGMIGLAATYAVAVRLFDRRTGLMALVVLGTASFFVYYSREARMYTLVMALAALATLAYVRWRNRSSLFRALVYGGLLAALIYTQYVGALVGLTHLIHLLVTRGYIKRSVHASSGVAGAGSSSPPNPLSITWRGGERQRFSAWEGRFANSFIRYAIPYVVAGVLFAPWMSTLLAQMRDNPNGPLAIPVATDAAAIDVLVATLTSGHWWLMAAPFVLGSAIPRLRQYGREVLLLALWLVVTPAVLLALNAWFAPVYQVRYTIAALPAGALLVAFGLRWVGLPTRVGQRWFAPMVTAGLLAWIVYTQLSVYPYFWPQKPRWEMTLRAVDEVRGGLEPIITDFAPYSPPAYYDRQLNVRHGIALDLSWRLHSAAEARERTAVFENEPAVWMALPVNTAKTWHIAAALDAGRGAGYRASLENMIFYRFDRGGTDDLRFRFGDAVRFESGPGAGEQFTVPADESMCASITLEALRPLDGSLSVGLHLVDLSGQAMVAQSDGGLSPAEAGERISIEPCVVIPPETAPGYYHLELVVYEWATLRRLPVIEDGRGDGVGWGDVLMLAAVDVIDK